MPPYYEWCGSDECSSTVHTVMMNVPISLPTQKVGLEVVQSLTGKGLHFAFYSTYQVANPLEIEWFQSAYPGQPRLQSCHTTSWYKSNGRPPIANRPMIVSAASSTTGLERLMPTSAKPLQTFGEVTGAETKAVSRPTSIIEKGHRSGRPVGHNPSPLLQNDEGSSHTTDKRPAHHSVASHNQRSTTADVSRSEPKRIGPADSERARTAHTRPHAQSQHSSVQTNKQHSYPRSKDSTSATHYTALTINQNAPPPSITIGHRVITADSASQYRVGSKTLSAGGPPMTVSGVRYSIVPAGTAIVVQDRTSPIANLKDRSVTLPGHMLATPVASNDLVLNAGPTLQPGSPGATVSGTTYSIPSSTAALVVNGHTFPIADASRASAPGHESLPGVTLANGHVLFNGQTLQIHSTATFGSGLVVTRLALTTNSVGQTFLLGDSITRSTGATSGSTALQNPTISMKSVPTSPVKPVSPTPSTRPSLMSLGLRTRDIRGHFLGYHSSCFLLSI